MAANVTSATPPIPAAAPARASETTPSTPVGILGARLAQARLRRGLSTRRLGLWLGRSHAMVSRWERGVREPTLFDLDRITVVLRIDLDDLLADLAIGPTRRGCSSRAHSPSFRLALGQTLGRLRAEVGESSWDVYQATSVDPRRLRQLEAGADPGIGEAVALVTLYETVPSELLRLAKMQRRRNLDNDRASPTTPLSRFGQPPDRDGAGA